MMLESDGSLMTCPPSTTLLRTIIDNCSSASNNNSPTLLLNDLQPRKMSNSVPCAVFPKDDVRSSSSSSSSSSLVVDDAISRMMTTCSPPEYSSHHHFYHHSNNETTNGSPGASGRVATCGQGGGGRNKRKNFQPRCTIPTMDDITAPATDQSSMMVESCTVNVDDKSAPSLDGGNKNNHHLNKSIEDLLNSSLTNSLITRMITDMNSQQQQPIPTSQSQSLAGETVRINKTLTEHQPLDLSNQELDPSQTNKLLEMFLSRNIRNQFLATITNPPSSSAMPLLTKDVQPNHGSKVTTDNSSSGKKPRINQTNQQRSQPIPTKQSFGLPHKQQTSAQQPSKRAAASTSVPPDGLFALRQSPQQSTAASNSNNNNFLDLFQIYNNNRENYLKLLHQQQQQLQNQSSQPPSARSSIRMKDDHHNNGNGGVGNHHTAVDDEDELDDEFEPPKNHSFDDDSDDDVDDRLSGSSGQHLMPDLYDHPRATKHNSNKDNNNGLGRRSTIESPSTSTLLGDQNQFEGNGDDIEKLKQLQHLYRFDLKQPHGGTISSATSSLPSSIGQHKNPFESRLQQSQHKLSNSSSRDNCNHHSNDETTINSKVQPETSATSTIKDNVAYVQHLFKDKIINQKSSSRRPLSSWKQSINACGPGPAPWIEKSTLYSLGIQGELINKSSPIDYTRYVKRYANGNECGNNLCKEKSYREHFHCNALSCNSRVFMKKEEMIRHFKWHKKRDESLTHGFLRCSPGDNCVERFKTCPHHHKQTHYHCLKRGCDKVYISTSDVQMHANYHRKDTAIIQEGFQRFRATENCLLECCAFFGQKTTHFHCRRDNCNHTFKNKADMEKHKSYHIRDEQLARDGFKKFMKHETCTFEECRSSRVCNHIHCIRSGCTHILHSTNQLYLHKCKHERCEKELAYRKYRLAQSINRLNQFESNGGNNCIRHRLAQCGINLDANLINQIDDYDDADADSVNESFETLLLNHVGQNGDEQSALENLSQRLPLAQIGLVPIEDIVSEDVSEAKCPKYIQRHNQIIADQCNFEYEPPKTLSNSVEHFNCNHCNICWLDHSSAFKHAWKHVIQEETVPMIFKETNDESVCNEECSLKHTVRHYHCRMLGCPFVIPLQNRTLKMLEHYKFHEDQQIMCPLEEYMATNSSVTLSNETPVASKSSSSASSKSSSSKQHPPETNNNNNTSHNNNNNNNNNSINVMNDNNVPGKAIANKPETSQSLQVFPTGTALISVDGMPILKRKRGRPPKNRSATELLGSKKKGSNNSNNNSNSNSSNQHSDQSMAPTLGTMSSYELAQAFNLSLDHAASIFSHIPASRDDLSKTIPIPLIMPYIKSSIHIGFYVFDGETLCPDVTCQFLGQKHFHCSKPRCYYSTNRDDILQEHSKDFHDSIDILEGFVYFDENIDCKLPSCQYNKQHKHFHCTRAGCSFSFVRYSLMGSHDEKHFRERLKSNLKSSSSSSLQEDLNLEFNKSDESQCSLLPNDDLKLANDVDDEDDQDDHNQLQQLKHPINDFKNGVNQVQNESLLQTSLQKLLDGRMNALGVLPSIPIPFTSATAPTTITTTTTSSISSDEVIKQHSSFDENHVCNSPFCKLKRRIHFHCNICNQAFTTYERLVPHYLKHIDSMYSDNHQHHHHSNVVNESESISSAVSNPYNFTTEFFQAFFNNLVNLPPTSSPVNNPLLTTAALPTLPNSDPTNSMMKTSDTGINEHNNKRRRSSFSSDGSSNDYGSRKLSKQDDAKSDVDEMNNQSCGRSNNNSAEDSSPPPPSSSNCSYSRFRFNEDCGFPFCVYREHQTHFHCMRKDCGYSFCDKTRFVQHTARHERLDTLMGGDFQQFRSSVTCGHMDCVYVNANISTGNKTSHFHCLKCDYVCADTNKVVAHRRQHAKMDNISAAGFEKYAPNQDCFKELCNYKLKQTHYHCSTCNYSVLGLSQMSSHKQKHQQQQQQLQTQPTQHPHSPTSDPTPPEE